MRKTVLIAALICLFAMPFAYGQAIPDQGFETWTTHGTTFTYQVPTGWATIDSFTSQAAVVGLVSQDSFYHHGGNYSIKLQSKTVITAVVPGAACSGIIHLVSPSPLTYTILGGFPVSAKPNFLAGWFRDSLPGVDTSYIVAFFTKWDTNLGKRDTVAYGGLAIDSNHLSWTPFQLAILSDSLNPVTPDTGVVVFYSGKGSGGVVGSTLWVDDLGFTTGIGELDPLNGNYDLYPNPASQNLYIVNNNLFKKISIINVYDEMGRKVNTSNLNEDVSVLNVKSLSAGIYFYQIVSLNQTLLKTGKFIVE
jgi:hypothetical protein